MPLAKTGADRETKAPATSDHSQGCKVRGRRGQARAGEGRGRDSCRLREDWEPGLESSQARFRLTAWDSQVPRLRPLVPKSGSPGRDPTLPESESIPHPQDTR